MLETDVISLTSKLFTLLSVAVVAVVLVWSVMRAFQRARVAAATLRALWLVVGLVCTGYVVLGICAYHGVFSGISTFPPPQILPVAILPLGAGLWLVTRAMPEGVVDVLEPAKLVAFQIYRFFPEILLVLLIRDGAAGEQMTFTGRNFDILVPLTALPAAILYGRGAWFFGRRALIAWNVIGMLILTNTVVTAVFSLPTAAQLFPAARPFLIPVLFPTYLLPSFYVALAYALHVLTIRRLLR